MKFYNVLLWIPAVDCRSLMEVFGELPSVGRMQALSRPARGFLAQDDCAKGPLEVVLVQDCTSSLADDWAALAEWQLPLMIDSLRSTHPGSRFGTVLFQDKPVEPLGISPTAANGWYSDFCVRTDGTLHQDADGALALYREHTPYGGGDVFEGQFVGLLAATQLPFGWSGNNPKLVVLITDAPPHFDLDGRNPGMAPHTDLYDLTDPETQCVSQYHPSPEQVAASVKAAHAYVAVLAYDTDNMNHLVSRSWEWFVRYLNQTDVFLQIMDNQGDSSEFWPKLQKIIQEVEAIECATEDTSTTGEPTRSPGTLPPGPSGTAITDTTEWMDSTDDCPTCPPLPPCTSTLPPGPSGTAITDTTEWMDSTDDCPTCPPLPPCTSTSETTETTSTTTEEPTTTTTTTP